MTRTLLPEIHTPETLAALADAVLAVLGDWGVAPARQVELPGLAASPIPGKPLSDDPDVLERAGHLLGIERALKRSYPDDPAARHAWLMLPESGVGAQPPLRVMLDGVEGIRRARSLLENGAAAPPRRM